MIKIKDIEELRERLKRSEDLGIVRIRTMYCDSNDDICIKQNGYFLDLPDDEFYRYLDIIRELFSVKVNEKIIKMTIRDPEVTEKDIRPELGRIVNDELKSADIVDELFNRIKDYMRDGRYLVTIVNDKYDIPKVAADGVLLDESEEVYSYIAVAICPVYSPCQRLEYKGNDIGIITGERRLEVASPTMGFIYPAFTDRTADYDNIMYYTSDNKTPLHDFMGNCLQCETTYTATEKRNILESTVKNMTRVDTAEKVIKEVYKKISTIYSDTRNIYNILTAEQLLNILSNCEYIDEFTAGKIAESYRSNLEPYEPTIYELHNKRMVKAAEEEDKKKKIQDLLILAAMAIETSSDRETELSRELRDTAGKNRE